ncbi:MAG: hypothetical protein H0U16_05385 [Actinobacteria bacterium]|nr:hypothetical protein [Actinomycetota bacterium]
MARGVAAPQPWHVRSVISPARPPSTDDYLESFEHPLIVDARLIDSFVR